MAEAVDNATLPEILKACVDAGKETGTGRFTFTIQYSEDTQQVLGYVTHWFRPTPYAFEDCRVVGEGSARQCIEHLARYVETFEETREALPETWQPELKQPVIE